MAKEAKQNKKNRRKSKDEKSINKKKAGSSKIPLLTGECVLRKLIKNKKKKRYTASEVGSIYDSIREPKSGFPLYQATVYSDNLVFVPVKRSKKIKPIKLTSIGQIIQVTGDPRSFLLHVPKSKNAKQFTGLFTWLDSDMPAMFEKAIRDASVTSSKVAQNTDTKDAVNEDSPTDLKATRSQSLDDLSAPRYQKGPYLATYLSSSEHNVYSSSSDIVRVSKGIVETYTHYAPQQNVYLKPKREMRHQEKISESSFSSNDYFGNDSDDSAYICRDKNSIFYGERMSPKSQYIDRLLRATVQMQNENVYS